MRIIDAHFRAVTLAEDGWPRVWATGLWGSGDFTEVMLSVDRDRYDEARTKVLIPAATEAFARTHPTERPLRFRIAPATRLEIALQVVKDHMEECLTRERERLVEGGERWAWVPDQETLTGWTAEQDQVVVEIVSEHSAHEMKAAQLGEHWIASLIRVRPEFAAIVKIVGSSH